MAIFVAVFVLDADFHATAGAVLIEVTAVVPIPVRMVPVSILPLAVSSAIHVATAAHLTLAKHSVV